MTTNADHARELVAEAKRQGVHLIMSHGWHYSPFIQEAKERMDRGEVGDIEFVQCHMASPLRGLLTGGNFEYNAAEMFMLPESSTWADPNIAGGGYGFSQMAHSAGMLYWLTGLAPRKVFAVMSAPASKVELYDAMSVQFDGGVIGSFSGAGTIPADRGFQLDIRIFGTEGVLSLDLERARLQVLRDDGNHYESDLAANAGDYDCDGPPNNFVDLILGKTESNHAPGEVGMKSIEMLDAAYRSSKSGKFEDV